MNTMTETSKDTLRIAAQVTAAIAVCVGTVTALMFPVITAL